MPFATGVFSASGQCVLARQNGETTGELTFPADFAKLQFAPSDDENVVPPIDIDVELELEAATELEASPKRSERPGTAMKASNSTMCGIILLDL